MVVHHYLRHIHGFMTDRSSRLPCVLYNYLPAVKASMNYHNKSIRKDEALTRHKYHHRLRPQVSRVSYRTEQSNTGRQDNQPITGAQVYPSLALTRHSFFLPLRAWRRLLSRRGNNSQATLTKTAILKLRHTNEYGSNMMNTRRKSNGFPNAPVNKTKPNAVTTSPLKDTSKPVDALPLNKEALMTPPSPFTWWRGRGGREQR